MVLVVVLCNVQYAGKSRPLGTNIFSRLACPGSWRKEKKFLVVVATATAGQNGKTRRGLYISKRGCEMGFA